MSAAYLVDPVDLSRWSPESADNPSGGWAARCFNPKSELGVGGCIVCTVCHTKQLPSRRDTLLPAAARALRESGLAVGITAAGVTGSCNPTDGSSAFMWAAAGNGSWLGIEPGERRQLGAGKQLEAAAASAHRANTQRC